MIRRKERWIKGTNIEHISKGNQHKVNLKGDIPWGRGQ
jgi:hypothetical protein